MANVLYSSLITQAINDFDSIYDKLVAKHVEGYTVEHKADGTIPTKNYADAINTYLARVDGKTIGDLTGITENGTIVYNGVSGAGTISVDYTNKKVSVSLAKAGYYESKASISASITTVTGVLSGDTPESGSPTGYSITKSASAYKLTPSGNSVFDNVTVDIGSCNMTVDDVDFTKISADAELSIGNSGTATGTLVADAPTDGSFIIPLQVVPSFSGTLNASVKADASFKPGYFTSINVPAAKETTVEKTVGTSVNKSLKIAAASIDITTTATPSISTPSAVVLSDTEGGYKVDITAPSTATSTITAGYVGEGGVDAKNESIVNITNNGGTLTKYIKKGSLGTAEGNKDTVTISGDLNTTTSTGTGASKAYKTTFSVDKAYSKKITDGYIAAADATFQANITGTKEISIKAGSVTANAGTVGFTKSGTNSNLFLEAAPTSGEYISFKTSAKSTITTTSVEGYIHEEDVSIPATISGEKTYYVAKGSVTPTVSFSAAVTEKHGDEVTGEKHEIFKDSLTPTEMKSDYYTVTMTPGATLTSGYISTVEAATPTIKYIPKAKLKYVEAMGDQEKSFVEVTEAGYLASGISLDLQGITGTIDTAVVNVNLASDVLTAGTAGTGDYTITLAKGSINAGYISDKEGKVNLTNYHVKKTSATISNAVSIVNLSATPTFNAKTNKYKFSGAGKGTATVELAGGKGYIRISDLIAGNGITLGTADSTKNTAQYDVNAGLELDKAVLKVGTDNATVNIVKTEDVTKTADGKYVLKVKVKSDETITATAITSGYVDSTFTQDLIVTSAETPIEVAAGKKLTTVAGIDDDTKKITGAVVADSNKYKVTLPSYDIAVSGSLTEGYYADTLLDVSGNATVTEKSLEIDAAAASVTASGTAPTIAVTGADGLISTSAPAGTGTYVTLTAAANGSLSAAVGTKGYLNVPGQISLPAITGSTPYYIKKAPASYTVGNTSAVNFTDDLTETTNVSDRTNSQTELTANTVNTGNITITLASDAMGSNVEANIRKLQRRLGGFAASVTP